MRTLLFVCTGNTCRSPMAEAIANAQLKVRNVEGDYAATSAGIAAMSGNPTTPEAIEAVRGLGLEYDGTASSPLTQSAIDDAATIFALTRAHMDAILRVAPQAADRVFLLDPKGSDVPDPIGFPQDVYDETAKAIERFINARLDEILATA